MSFPLNTQFPLGQIVATRAALQVLTPDDIVSALNRHSAKDWGNIDPCDRQANDLALLHGSRILSAYQGTSGESFWIITEADRSSTTVLLPSDY